MAPLQPIPLAVLVLPDAFMSSVMGFVDTFSVPGSVLQKARPFDAYTIAESSQVEVGPSRLPLSVDQVIGAGDVPQIIVIPALVIGEDDWVPGRYPRLVEWLRAMHDRGALLCSACSGSLLLAETGLLDGRIATSHWALDQVFMRVFPQVSLRLDREIVVSEDARLVMSGAAAAWHDLAMYLVARFAGPSTAATVARFFMMQWHASGQAPYRTFREQLRHGDAAVLRAQSWLRSRWADARPVEGMTRAAALPGRSFARRFRRATGCSPIKYVQAIRIEHAKRALEESDESIDEICRRCGYEDTSFFRRLFKRVTTLSPADYRRKFRPPEYLCHSPRAGRVKPRR
jgi:transcriptional regulator GlxA family with amidase domain